MAGGTTAQSLSGRPIAPVLPPRTGVTDRGVAGQGVAPQPARSGHACRPEDLLRDVVRKALSGDSFDDQAEDDVTGVRITLFRAGLESERLAGEERQVVGERAKSDSGLGRIAFVEEVAYPRAMGEQLRERDAFGDLAVGIVRQTDHARRETGTSELPEYLHVEVEDCTDA